MYKNNVIIEDIDSDGKKDILFGSYEDDDADFSGNVWRFDNKGNVVWKRHVGHKVYFGGKLHQNHFRVWQICVVDLDQNGQNEIIQIAFHFPEEPVCIHISDVYGKLIAEYWHVGQFNVVDFLDINNDGVDEILLGGQNNEYRNAVLAILDYRLLQGCSPQTPTSEFYPDSLASGTEMFYLRFPKTKFQKPGPTYRDKILTIKKRKNGITAVVTNQYPNKNWSYPVTAGLICYDLNKKMELISDPWFGDTYKSLLIDHFGFEPEPDDYQRILYWDGNNWIDKPTVNRRWKKLKEK